jgi:hypothetical protein
MPRDIFGRHVLDRSSLGVEITLHIRRVVFQLLAAMTFPLAPSSVIFGHISAGSDAKSSSPGNIYFLPLLLSEIRAQHSSSASLWRLIEASEDPGSNAGQMLVTFCSSYSLFLHLVMVSRAFWLSISIPINLLYSVRRFCRHALVALASSCES